MPMSPVKCKSRNNALDYEVEKILDHKYYKDNPNSGIPNEYFVKWKDWPDTTNSWVCFEHMQCYDLIQKYLEQKDLNISRIEKEKRQQAAGQSATTKSISPKAEEKSSEDYHVEKVLKHRGALDPKTKLPKEFLLKWEGFSEKENTWEPTTKLNSGIYENYIEEHRLGWFHPDLLDESSEESGNSGDSESRTPPSNSPSKLHKISARLPHASFKRERAESTNGREKISRLDEVRKKVAVAPPGSNAQSVNVDQTSSKENPSLTDIRNEKESSLLTSDEEWD